MPRSPTSCSYCFGNDRMSSARPAVAAACSTEIEPPRSPRRRGRHSESETVGTLNLLCDLRVSAVDDRPKAIFSASVSLNKNVSCGTKPIERRVATMDNCRTGLPSINTLPSGASSRRGIRFISVDLPLPVLPTNATVFPGSILRSISSRPVCRYRQNVRSRNSTAPLIGGCSGLASSSLIVGSVSRIALNRFSDAVPR